MKSMILKKLIYLLVFLQGSMVFSQITVSGVVNDAGGPIPGVNVLVRGTANGTVSDFDGKYVLENVPEDAVLVFSYVGFKAQEIAVAGQTTINVTMEEDAAELEQVVVVGYGTVRKKDITGAVATVKPEDFNQGVQNSPDQLIQGRVAGVQVTAASGEPGAANNIRIRGTSSIRGGNNPLIVVDGVPLDGGNTSAGTDVGTGRSSARNPLNFINPNDIASIDVLKDASATAIYGSRGSNGVVIITTKKGKSGKPQLDFSSAISVSSIANEYDLLDASGFSSAVNAIGEPGLDFGQDVDALDEILRTAITQNYNLSYGGGSDTGRYRFSLSLQDQEGIIKNTGQEKYTGTLNLTEKFFDEKLQIDTKLITSFIKDEATALAENATAEGDLIISALRWNPTRSLFNPDGSFLQFNDNPRNPLAFLEYYTDLAETTNILGNLSATYSFTDAFSYKFNFGVGRTESKRRIGISRLMQANFVNGGIADIQNIFTSNLLFEHTLNYNKQLNDAVFLDAVVGYSYQQFERRGDNLRVQDFSIDDQNLYINNVNFGSERPAPTLNSDNTLSGGNTSFFDPNTELQSYFGRANVTLYDKYLITATLRADGSSRFGDDEQYGYFPSAAVAWRLSQEDFIPDTFSDLKLRVGYGLTGNQEFPSGSAQTQFTPDGSGGIVQSTVGNPNLKWESTVQINAGIDFGFLDNRITGSVDYYQRTTEDLLFRTRAGQQAPNVFIWRNLDGVEVENSGVDIAINGIIIDNEDISWEVGVNASFLSNELNNVSSIFPAGILTGELNGQGLTGQRAQLLFDGQPINAFYLPIWEGFDENGVSSYADLDGDGIDTSSGITAPGEGDRAFVGDPNPDFTIGISSAFRYKNLDVSVFFNGAYGHQIYDNTANAIFTAGALAAGGNVTEQVVASGEANQTPKPSTQYLKSGDFLRLNNLTLGYTLNGDKIGKWIDSLRFYATGQNIFVITPYDGFDPEVNVNKAVDGVPSFGIDYSTYPRARTFSLGFNARF
ncbi:SusC/RagA family TonB-linked outer membrane protein [Aquimarina algicola]|uniref:TonB-dependent receptor n=1 Tax=Aquimarina algicola TaxID=2589995 RepID=A0A504JEV8_9FLAO|nr:TonB-dependent receptor [Aquimarina algicola]TPN87232.1 TonB-dependent receptor [Aquimarina algicola]